MVTQSSNPIYILVRAPVKYFWSFIQLLVAIEKSSGVQFLSQKE